MAETLRQRSTEAVGVDVEESKVGEETELFRQMASDVSMVQVDSGDRRDIMIILGRCAVHPLVIADIQAIPVRSEVLGVRKNHMLPRLKSCVSTENSRVWKRGRRRKRILVRRCNEGKEKQEEPTEG